MINEIDLHGDNQEEAIATVSTALWELDEGNVEELHIITGNGAVLKGMVIDVLRQENYNYYIPQHNEGMIIVKR